MKPEQPSANDQAALAALRTQLRETRTGGHHPEPLLPEHQPRPRTSLLGEAPAPKNLQTRLDPDRIASGLAKQGPVDMAAGLRQSLPRSGPEDASTANTSRTEARGGGQGGKEISAKIHGSDARLTAPRLPDAQPVEARMPEARPVSVRLPQAQSVDARLPQAQAVEAHLPEAEATEPRLPTARPVDVKLAPADTARMGPPLAETRIHTSAPTQQAGAGRQESAPSQTATAWPPAAHSGSTARGALSDTPAAKTERPLPAAASTDPQSITGKTDMPGPGAQMRTFSSPNNTLQTVMTAPAGQALSAASQNQAPQNLDVARPETASLGSASQSAASLSQGSPAGRHGDQPAATSQPGSTSLAGLMETLEHEWRADISAIGKSSTQGPGLGNPSASGHSEMVQHYAESISGLLSASHTTLIAGNGHQNAAVVAENSRRERFDREVGERLKRIIAAGPSGSERLSDMELASIHAEALRRQLIDNGVLAPNEDLPEAPPLSA